MLYLSAQPDDYYFMWQLELQLHNFKQLGVGKAEIHILIAVKHSNIPLRHFSNFIKEYCNDACFYVYPDNRMQKEYPSSIRPHIIKQHFQKFPSLKKETIFYHDSDIIFRELPNFETMLNDDIWYVSDTRNYLDVSYIKSSSGSELFTAMCRSIGIDESLVIANDVNAGGAQYLLKNTDFDFWDKIERDSESLYTLMTACNNQEAEQEFIKNGNKRSEYKGIQAWCADMWAVLWNAWLKGYTVQISRELDFCWPYDPVDQWYSKKILHYSGKYPKENKSVFSKENYIKFPPFYDPDIRKISPHNCSYPIRQLTIDIRGKKNKKRIPLKNVSFLIPLRIDSQSRLDNLTTITRYLDKYFDTHIIILESDKEPKIDKELLPDSCRYLFHYDESPLLHRTKINNELIRLASTPVISLYDTDVIIPVEQILQSILLLKEGKIDMVYPYDGSFVSVDSLFKEMFIKLLDDELFLTHKEKFIVGAARSFGGAVFINTQNYITAGGENENFTGWRPEDAERYKRMKILGYNVKKIKGNLYHLPHERFSAITVYIR